MIGFVEHDSAFHSFEKHRSQCPKESDINTEDYFNISTVSLRHQLD